MIYETFYCTSFVDVFIEVQMIMLSNNIVGFNIEIYSAVKQMTSNKAEILNYSGAKMTS